ncbi:MAG: O-antigen ligase family protein, partial [Candidatus Desantisbacteria bacterium]
MVVNFFKTKSSVVWLLSIIVCVGGISGVYGIIQQLDICPAAWMPNDLYRVSSFFGNPVFYAAYTMMAFLIGMGLYLFSGCERIERSDSDRKGLRGTPWLSIFWGICLLVIFCGFCLANTRGCYLGLFGGVITFFCLAGKELLSKYRIRLIIISLGIFIIFGWYNIITTEYSVLKRFSQIYPVSSNEGKGASDPSSDIGFAGSQRIFIWKTAIEIVKDHPLFGIGIDTLSLIYPLYLRDIFPEEYGSMGQVADKTHNDLLDHAVCQGLIGLGVYLWGLLAFFAIAWRFYRYSSSVDRPIFIAFISFAIGFLIQNQFSFSIPCISCIIAVLVAGMVVYGRQLSIPLICKTRISSLFLFSNCTQSEKILSKENIHNKQQTLSWMYYLII